MLALSTHLSKIIRTYFSVVLVTDGTHVKLSQ